MANIQKGYASLQIDKRIPGVGRIKRAIGSAKPQVRAVVTAMLADLLERGRYDDLRSIKNGTVSIPIALHQWKKNRLRGSESIGLTQPITPTVFEWLEHHDVV